jgi:tungstate transport system permease protein
MEIFVDGFQQAIALICQLDRLVMGAAIRSIWISTLAVAIAALAGIPIGSCLARRKFWGRTLAVLFFRASMGMPTVLIGLICYASFSRRGPLGGLDLLYTPWGIVAGEFLLALPIIVSWTQAALMNLEPAIPETARTLGASPLRRWRTYLSEARVAIALALLTAFARCFTELGIAMMVGGNIKYRTRTLATATALETAQGDFARGFAMGLILFFMALVITAVVGLLTRPEKRP